MYHARERPDNNFMYFRQENYSSVSLKSVEVDGRVGVEIKDRALYFYINGKNQGKVETELRSQNCWAVVDLYGQCVEVEIVSSSALNVSESSSVVPEQRKVLPKGSPCQYQALVHRFFNTLVIPGMRERKRGVAINTASYDIFFFL